MRSVEYGTFCCTAPQRTFSA